MKVLILGSQGFIGSNLVDYFITQGHNVFGCDLMELTSSMYTYQKVSVLSSDFDSLLIDEKFDACINASGSGNVSFSVGHPISDFEANTYSVAKVLDTIHKYQPACKYMHISSAAVYGNPETLPITEQSKLGPLSPYGYHKWMSELLCKEYHHLYKLPIAVLRPFSVYGNRLRKQLLWDICQKLQAQDKILLYGTGNESRDFIHISDLCSLIDLVIKHSNFEANIYNAATGNETTIREIADIFCANYPGKEIGFSGECKPGDPVNWRADISRIKAYGFKQTISLEDGIKEYIHWFSK